MKSQQATIYMHHWHHSDRTYSSRQRFVTTSLRRCSVNSIVSRCYSQL